MTKNGKPFGDLCGRVFVHSISIIMTLLLLANSFCTIGSWCIGIILAAIAALGAKEFYTMAEIKSGHPKKTLGAVTVFIFLILSFVSIRFFHYFPGELGKNLPWIFLIPITGFLIFSFGSLENSAVMNVGTTLFGILYLGVPLKLFFEILYGFNNLDLPKLGIWLTAYLICVTKGADVFSYFFGKAFGKRKISPVLSPKKTVVGLVCGLIGSGLIGMLFSTVMSTYYKPLSFKSSSIIVLIAIILGFIGFLGDIAESIFKRDASVKDSYAFKAIGGVLDNLDSLLFASPVFYFILRIFDFFGLL
ncbi:MAG: phosphatidate cytidylyltransferase [Victivallaceae bacterium]